MANEVRWTETGLDDLIRDVSTIGRVPVFRVIRGLEEVLRDAFLDTQHKTHVISGSLKASGHSDSEFHGYEWHGFIEYGGPLLRTPIPEPGHSPSATAPNDPVDYAIYEMARGGDHDFFSDMALYEELYEDAVMRHADEL